MLQVKQRHQIYLYIGVGIAILFICFGAFLALRPNKRAAKEPNDLVEVTLENGDKVWTSRFRLNPGKVPPKYKTITAREREGTKYRFTEHVGPAMMVNNGNMCFALSAFHCLANLQPLTKYIADHKRNPRCAGWCAQCELKEFFESYDEARGRVDEAGKKVEISPVMLRTDNIRNIGNFNYETGQVSFDLFLSALLKQLDPEVFKFQIDILGKQGKRREVRMNLILFEKKATIKEVLAAYLELNVEIAGELPEILWLVLDSGISPLKFGPELVVPVGSGSTLYELQAFVSRDGDAAGRSGHFTAFVKTLEDKRWWRMSDNDIFEVSTYDAFCETPSFLFYTKKRSK